MNDLQFITRCDHKISHYKLDIYGELGDYKAQFPCDIVMLKNRIFIRSYNDEMDLIHNLDDHKELSTRILTNDSLAHISEANNLIGIHNYEFIDKRTIRFTQAEHGERTIDPNPLLVPRNIYYADFIADPAHCPRCDGSGYIKDVHVNSTGNLSYVSGKLKIRQRIIKCLITPLGSSPYNPYFGSELSGLIGNVITEDFRVVLQKTVENAIDNLIEDQPIDLDPEERIVKLITMSIDTPTTDRTVVKLDIAVMNDLGETVDNTIGFNIDNMLKVN